MPCYNPIRTVMGSDHRLHFDRDYKNARYFKGETVINVPCRKCIGCGQAIAREWSVRGFHQALGHTQMHTSSIATGQITTEIPNSSVITLTYNDEHLPHVSLLGNYGPTPEGTVHVPKGVGGILVHDHFQRFIKRLRKRRTTRGNHEKLSYFMCGEYGGLTARPHFHAVIFGETFGDQYTETTGQQMSYELDELWSQPECHNAPPTKIGRATIDTFSFAGAGYVSGYVAKKTYTEGHQGPTLETADPHGVVRLTPITPEYRKMSTHPGIGHDWLVGADGTDHTNLLRTYEEDNIKISKWIFHPPKYYDLLLNRTRPDLVEQVIKNRRNGVHQNAEEWTKERCSAAELIALDSLQLRRDSL